MSLAGDDAGRGIKVVPRRGIIAPVVLATDDRGFVIGDGALDKISYAEAREWFWVRTAVWSLPAAIVSAIACFIYYEPIVNQFSTRLTYSAVVGIGGILFAVAASAISIQFPWMRLGRARWWLLNALLCAAMSALGATLLCGVVLSVMRDNIHQYPSEEVIATAYEIMLFAIAITCFWGAVLGGWFALRRDKFFVEQI